MIWIIWLQGFEYYFGGAFKLFLNVDEPDSIEGMTMKLKIKIKLKSKIFMMKPLTDLQLAYQHRQAELYLLKTNHPVTVVHPPLAKAS